MTENNNRLTPKKSKALQSLLTTPSISEAAEKAGISERTLYRYMKDPSFNAYLRDAQVDVIKHTTMQLILLQEKALNVMNELLDASEIAPSLRLRTASYILNLSLTYQERTNDAKLKELEEMVQKLDVYVSDKLSDQKQRFIHY